MAAKTLKVKLAEADAEILELKQKLIDQADADAVKPFVIPDHITEPRAQLVYALADLTGKLESVAKRGDAGTGSFAYKYASVFDMIDQVRPLMSHRGLIFTGTMLIDHPKYMMAEVTTKSGNAATELMLPTEWELEHIGGGLKTIVIMGQAIGNDDKAHGKAFTSSQKLALRSMTAISTGDEDDIETEQHQVAGRGSQQPAQRKPPAGSRQAAPRNQINSLWGECPDHKGSGWFQSAAQKDQGFAPSHKIKDSDGEFCDYQAVKARIMDELGKGVGEHFGKQPGERYVAWMKAVGLWGNVPAGGTFSAYRPQDWIAVAGKLATDPPTPTEAVDEAPEPKAPADEDPGMMVDGQLVCGQPCEEAGIEGQCMLPPAHSDDIEHQQEPSLEAIAAADAEKRTTT